MAEEKSRAPLSYWQWLLSREPHARGLDKFVDWWLLLHLAIGIIATCLIPLDLEEVARTAIIPLTGILVGLAFAWVGSAQAILHSEELEEVYDHHPGGIENYAYSYLSAILVLLITIVAWSLAGAGLFDIMAGSEKGPLYKILSFILYFLSSLAIRECWHVVLFSQLLVVMKRTIRKGDTSDSSTPTKSD